MTGEKEMPWEEGEGRDRAEERGAVHSLSSEISFLW